MSFTSIDFLLFGPLAVALYYLSPEKQRWRLVLLLSLCFYGFWEPNYLPLIIFSSLVDFIAALNIHKSLNERRRLLWLLSSIVINIGLLSYFKLMLGNDSGAIIIPIGLSFYTLQSLSYTFDTYKNKITPENNFGIFLLYVSFFPQLVAGPIERTSKLLPQLRKLGLPTAPQFWSGITLIFWGLSIKLIIADGVTKYIGVMYEKSGSFYFYWLASYLVMIKVYLDFMAYSEIARGLARLLGVELSLNFRRPFFAKNLTSFWQRWHMTLTRWIIDYIQVPLLRRFNGDLLRIGITMVTFCIIGLWHGPTINFILFGLLHGVAMSLWRPVAKLFWLIGIRWASLRVVFARCILHIILALSAPLFYIKDFNELTRILTAMLSWSSDAQNHLSQLFSLRFLMLLLFLTLLAIFELLAERNTFDLQAFIAGSKVRVLCFFALSYAAIVVLGAPSEPFVYFQF